MVLVRSPQLSPPPLPNETNKGTIDDHRYWPVTIIKTSQSIQMASLSDPGLFPHSPSRYIPSHQNETITRQGREDGLFAFTILCCAKTNIIAKLTKFTNNIAFQQLKVGWTQEEGSNAQALSSVTDSVPLSPHSRLPTQRSLVVIT